MLARSLARTSRVASVMARKGTIPMVDSLAANVRGMASESKFSPFETAMLSRVDAMLEETKGLRADIAKGLEAMHAKTDEIHATMGSRTADQEKFSKAIIQLLAKGSSAEVEGIQEIKELLEKMSTQSAEENAKLIETMERKSLGLLGSFVAAAAAGGFIEYHTQIITLLSNLVPTDSAEHTGATIFWDHADGVGVDGPSASGDASASSSIDTPGESMDNDR